jgi:hypothetical protein
MASATYEAAKEHFRHLVRTNQLPCFKRGGRIVKTQPTITKHSQITVAQQFKWHMLIDSSHMGPHEDHEPSAQKKTCGALSIEPRWNMFHGK